MSLSSGALLLSPVVDPVSSDWIRDRAFSMWAEEVPIGVMKHTIGVMKHTYRCNEAFQCSGPSA